VLLRENRQYQNFLSEMNLVYEELFIQKIFVDLIDALFFIDLFCVSYKI